jgi:hypothetical protein
MMGVKRMFNHRVPSLQPPKQQQDDDDHNQQANQTTTDVHLSLLQESERALQGRLSPQPVRLDSVQGPAAVT